MLLVCMGMANAAESQQSGKKGSTEIASIAAPGGPGDTDGPVEATEVGYEPVLSTMRIDSAGFVVDMQRADSHQGTMMYNKGLRRFDYAGTDGVASGYLNPESLQAAKLGGLAAYEDGKPKGVCRGPWTIPCLVIAYLVSQGSNKDSAGDDGAATCETSKRLALNAISQSDARCYADGGSPGTPDYGDMCGTGAKPGECNYESSQPTSPKP